MPAGRLILTASSLLLFACGGVALFAADMLGTLIAGSASPGAEALAQVAAAGLLGFAVLNWMSRGVRVGGVYARPLAVANFLLFSVAALSVGRALAAGSLHGGTVVVAGPFGLAALAFAWLAFFHDPLKPGGPSR